MEHEHQAQCYVQHQPSKVMIYWNKRTLLGIIFITSLCTLPQAKRFDITHFNAGGYLRNGTLITKLDVYPDLYFQNAGVELQFKASSKFKLRGLVETNIGDKITYGHNSGKVTIKQSSNGTGEVLTDVSPSTQNIECTNSYNLDIPGNVGGSATPNLTINLKTDSRKIETKETLNYGLGVEYSIAQQDNNEVSLGAMYRFSETELIETSCSTLKTYDAHLLFLYSRATISNTPYGIKAAVEAGASVLGSLSRKDTATVNIEQAYYALISIMF